ncbi:hypothetical protein CROQUDRAFT_41937 [Cronartium quercuum f. sp. fusiforme G11]|uniref:Uncharacterized protein n=1 Tax=Cronartium quercuum f. sp. fusiforme G11 TaxID=708437 RepID=A0A9P6NPM3_9BASI|nr:hypothetical protein CROQUDRAFT_41937 [Cronartium quercuum f. sp. fusiforme G11]
MIAVSQKLKKKGRRLQNTLAERLGRVYGRDESMDVEVRPDGARVELEGTSLMPVELFAGESVMRQLTIKNVGSLGLRRLACVVSHHTFFRIGSASEGVSSIYSSRPSESEVTQTKIELPNELVNNPPVSICDVLGPSDSITVPVVCRGEVVGQHTTFWLFVFQVVESGEWCSFRHIQLLEVMPSLQLKPIIRQSIVMNGLYTLTLEVSLLSI